MHAVNRKVKEMTLIFKINMMKFKLKRKFGKMRPNLDNRIIQTCRHSLMVVHPMMIGRLNEEEAGSKLARFMF
jgi:hypothetical protein